MKANKILYSFAFIAMMLVFQSCRKEISGVQQPQSNETKTKSVFLKQLKNPYTVANMQEALDNLLDGQSSYEITATHYYVKFMPFNDEELTVLSRTTLPFSCINIRLMQRLLRARLPIRTLKYQLGGLLTNTLLCRLTMHFRMWHSRFCQNFLYLS